MIHDERTGYDRLCAKELFAPDKTRKNKETGKREVVAKGTMSKLQEDFWREVASKYGYERPLPKELRQKGYRSLEAYKQHEGTTRELKAEIAAHEERLECLRQREGEIEQEIERLQPAAETVTESARTLYTARKDGEREKGLAGEIEGLRSRIGGAEREIEHARGLFEHLKEQVERVRGFVCNVGEQAAALLKSLGVDAFAGNPSVKAQGDMAKRVVVRQTVNLTPQPRRARASGIDLDREIGNAQDVARALNRDHASRGRSGQSHEH